MLFDGFVYEGQDIIMAGVVEVSGGMSPSPSSGEWTRMSIDRTNTDPEQWAEFTSQVPSLLPISTTRSLGCSLRRETRRSAESGTASCWAPPGTGGSP